MADVNKQVKTKKHDINKTLRKVWSHRGLYLILLPFLLFYVLFMYRPLYGLLMAFKDYSVFKGIADSPWVGFENFKAYFMSPYALRTIKNTLFISIYSIIFTFPLPIILALLLNEVKNKLFKKTIQTISYIPYFISTVVIASMVTTFLSPSNGIINIIIDKLGFEKIYFLTKTEYFRTILLTMRSWAGTGFGAIIYVAALTSVDPQLYEACVIDGGNRWKQTIHITLPGIAPTIIIMLIMRIGSIITCGYEDILLLYQPATYEVADTIGTYVYRAGIEGNNFGLATAVGVFQAVVSLIFVAGANALSKKITETSLW